MAILRPGNLVSAGLNNRSARVVMALSGVMAMETSTGASLVVIGMDDDDPMWRQTTVSVSSHAAQNGSQLALYRLGRPIFSGFSEKVTAWHPLDATRRISSAASWASHRTGTERG